MRRDRLDWRITAAGGYDRRATLNLLWEPLKALGVANPKAMFREIERAIRHYKAYENATKKPPPSKVRERLLYIRKHAAELRTAIYGVSDDVPDFLLFTNSWHSLNRIAPHLDSLVLDLEREARELSDAITEKPWYDCGRQPDKRVLWFVDDIDAAWERHVGTSAKLNATMRSFIVLCF